MKTKPTLIFSLASLLLFLLVYGLLPLEEKKAEQSAYPDDFANYPVWIEMMEQPSVNLNEARVAFDTYWENNEHFRGDRSKQFERWYHKNLSRMDANGSVISAQQVSSEFQRMRYDLQMPQLGDWYIYGPVNVAPRNGFKRDGGRVKDVDFHPADPNTLFASCYTSGFFKSQDNGSSWTPLTDHLVDYVHASEINPNNPDNIYIATNLGLKKTMDGGLTWTSIQDGAYSEGLLMKSDDANTLLLGSDDGIRKSTDGGNSWTLVLSEERVDAIIQHPSNPNIMYAGSNAGNFFRSVDAGSTWVKDETFPAGEYVKIAVTPAQPDYVYVIQTVNNTNNNSFGGVYRSTDAGATFTKQSGNGVEPCITCYNEGTFSRGQPNYNLFIVADPNDADLVYAGGVQSWKSTDGGATWDFEFNGVTTEGGNLHLDQLNWSYNPLNDRMYACNDGGIYYLDDNNKYQMITDGLPVGEVWEVSQSKTDYGMVAGGTFHCGIKLNSGGVWYTPAGGDNSFVLIDYEDNNYVYYAQYDRILRSTDGGFTYPTRLDPNDGERGSFTGTGFLDNADANVLYMGRDEVGRITNVRSNRQFTTISNFGGSANINKLEQSTANGSIAYVSNGNSFYITENLRDATPTFTELSLPFSGIVNDIATSPVDENLVTIILGSQIFKSTDKGITWTNDDPNQSLPSIALLEMVNDESSNEGIYIGTDIGVFYKDASMTDWIDFSENLPAIRVKGMDIFYGATRDESVLTIATDGRGFWRSPLQGVTTVAPVAEFSANRTTTNVGRPVQFINETQNNGYTYEWTFQGGTPSTSLDVSPEVIYSTPGTYDVSLTATNSAGQDVISKSGFITVNPGGTGDLQVHYKFEESLFDETSYLRDAEVSGTAAFESGYNGSGFAYSFTGANTLTIPAYKGIAGANERTVAAWIKTSSDGAISSWGPANTGSRMTFRLDGGKLRVEVSGGFVIGTATISDGEWHHVAFTFADDGTPNLADTKFYVDGVLDPIGASGNPIIVNTLEGPDVNLGVYEFGGVFEGAMDDFRIYSVALDATTIADLADPTVPGLISRYEFSENLKDDGSNEIDAVGNYGTITYVSDREGIPFNAMETPATSGQYLEIPTYKGVSGSKARSVTAWVKTTEAGTRKTILSWGANASGQMFNLMVDNNNVRVEGGASSYLTLDGTIEDDKWHHIAYTYNSNGSLASGNIYIDGVLQTNTSNFNGATNLNTSANQDVRIGDAFYNANYFFRGGLDDVRIYNRVITEQEINGMISQSLVGNLLRYDFDDTLADSGILGIDAASNYGSPTFTANRLNDSNSALASPETSGQFLGVPNYKGVEGNSARTISAWIKTTEEGTRKTVVSWGTNSLGQMFNLMVDNNNVRIEGGACSLLSVGAAIEDNKWHHIAYTFDPSNGATLSSGKIYIDGIAQTNVTGFNHTVTELNTTALDDVRIGDAAYNANYFFRGSLDEVTLHNEALTDSEILDLAGEFPSTAPEFPLSASYSFEGNLEDASEYGRDAQTVGTSSFVTGFPGLGQAYELTGTNFLTIPNYKGELLNQNRSMAAWVKTTENGKVIVNWGTPASGQKITVKTHSNGNLRLEVAGGFIVGSTTIADGEWHHIAFTFENDGTPNVTDALLYVDGTVDTISTSIARVINTIAGEDVQIGQDSFGNALSGFIDEVKMYSIALTSEEINALATPPPTGLISDYTFDGNLADAGTYMTNALSNFGEISYTLDKNGNANSAWQTPSAVGEHLTIPGFNGISSNTTRTVSAWVKPQVEGTRKTIVSWGQNTEGKMFNIMISDGEVRVEGGACNLSSAGANLEDGRWHHIAYTFDPNDGIGSVADGKLFIDGNLWSETTNFRGNIILDTASDVDVLIGDTFYNPNYYFRGDLDDVRIYDYVVTLEELRNEFCAISEEITIALSQEEEAIYLGYEPTECTTLSIESLTGGYGELNYVWSTGETTPTISVCPTEPTIYTLTVTDESGCKTSEASLFVDVIDVRCGNNNDKVIVCHKGKKSLCVDASEVQEHLNHGDSLGNCTNAVNSKYSTEDDSIQLYTKNGQIVLNSFASEQGVFEIFTIDGTKQGTYSFDEGETKSDYLEKGIYVVRIEHNGVAEGKKIYVD